MVTVNVTTLKDYETPGKLKSLRGFSIMETIEEKNDRTEWLKNNSYTEEERSKLIEDKVQRYLSQKEFDKKVRLVLKAR
jgi:hypothetical protein